MCNPSPSTVVRHGWECNVIALARAKPSQDNGGPWDTARERSLSLVVGRAPWEPKRRWPSFCCLPLAAAAAPFTQSHARREMAARDERRVPRWRRRRHTATVATAPDERRSPARERARSPSHCSPRPRLVARLGANTSARARPDRVAPPRGGRVKLPPAGAQHKKARAYEMRRALCRAYRQ